ncbi:hypothetical protein BCR32DRAFT_290883 [Anaeromyces robustus]|uniref:Membrane transporter protein n=1 Tax=Anaeromyces robustus TaxID=1754192 RepID=A0A1Y1XH74_9FUNG|nr:hypothetical protein BCR32DRAFT_290883 [Anaeromyces robustus]|eukprot:ORX85109.1 hypothetical protein BCR32DRAFT_290883 [Anaeromyces robustus]
MHFVFVIIITFIATLLGSLCGIGGGIIIKPMLDAISSFSPFQIALISMSCVLTTSLTSVLKHIYHKTKISFKEATTLGIGGILGGLLGSFLFDFVKKAILDVNPNNGHNIIIIIQNAGIAFFMILVLIYMLFLKKRKVGFHLKNLIFVGIIGLLLGMISVFLDIGGGAINVCIFILLFSMDVKLASINSLLVIVFSQSAKFVQYIIRGNFTKNVTFDTILTWWLFVILISISVFTGLLGSHLNRKLKSNHIDTCYEISIVAIIIIAGYNVISKLIYLSNQTE